MHHVRNNGETTQSFNVRKPDGSFAIQRLAPGKSGDFEIDPKQARFQRGDLSVTPTRTSAPAAKAKTAKKPAPKAAPTPAPAVAADADKA